MVCAPASKAAQPATPLVTLAQNGTARAVLYVPPDVMAADKTVPPTTAPASERDETDRRRLRESVRDLARYLGAISGARFEVRTSPPGLKDRRLPILIGAAAQAKFGAVGTHALYEQGFRVAVQGSGIGLWGESDLATSYAIYELLDRLGCRWYLPSKMGEVIPHQKNLSVPAMDFSSAPGTDYRGVWYADEDYKRRNRLGGLLISAGHNLEMLVTAKQRAEHPEWRAIVNGQPHAVRLKWSNPGVQQAVVDAIIAQFEAQHAPRDATISVSLSPDDGADFDESDDKAWDAGDFDPTMNQVSITDRYVKFCNIIAARVTEKYPHALFGFLAYVQYTRPPVREKPHPNLVPEIAPITYCRAHAFTDLNLCPSRPLLKPIVQGWGRVSKNVSYYNYMFHLAEVSVPYPMMHQMKQELPALYESNVRFWQPETMPNFESVLPGMVLTIRKAWNPREDSQKILDEFFTRFYGAAAVPMRRYWQTMDDAWTNTPEHAGGGWGHVRRFTPEVMKAARTAIDEALSAAATADEYRRVKMQDESLRQFERFMQMCWNMNEGKVDTLEALANRWLYRQLELGDEYAPQFAFGKVGWTPSTISGAYFKAFYENTYRDAARIARDCTVISPPLRRWKYAADKDKRGEEQNWHKPESPDADWKTTDVGIETWSTLGLPDYMGTLWYRSTVQVPEVPPGKKVLLWIPSEDGELQVWINGQPVAAMLADGSTAPKFSGYCQPISFDITSAVKPNAANTIAIKATRTTLNELGTGGLLMPPYIVRAK